MACLITSISHSKNRVQGAIQSSANGPLYATAKPLQHGSSPTPCLNSVQFLESITTGKCICITICKFEDYSYSASGAAVQVECEQISCKPTFSHRIRSLVFVSQLKNIATSLVVKKSIIHPNIFEIYSCYNILCEYNSHAISLGIVLKQ